MFFVYIYRLALLREGRGDRDIGPLLRDRDEGVLVGTGRNTRVHEERSRERYCGMEPAGNDTAKQT